MAIAYLPSGRAHKPKTKIFDLVPRITPHGLELSQRIQQLGWPIILEDQAAVIATYEWILRKSRRMSEDTSRRYIKLIETFLEGLGDWILPQQIKGPVTIWHLVAPGLGSEIVHAWRDSLLDNDEVADAVFGDSFRAIERFVREYLCQISAVIDYERASQLGRFSARQKSMTVITARYGTVTNPFPIAWRPGKKQKRREPVPTFSEWLKVLDALWARQNIWLDNLTWRKSFPKLRTVAMIHLQSMTGVRPRELSLVKQGDLLNEHLNILHGAEKDRLPRTNGEDIYGNKLGRYRQIPFAYVPDELRHRLNRWINVLEQMGAIAMESKRALFPGTLGADEGCVTYETYRRDFQSVLLDIADDSTCGSVLEPYIYKCSKDRERWALRITPHTLRAIYITYRLADPRGCNIRLLKDELGHLSYSALLSYDRPHPTDAKKVRDKLLEVLGEQRGDAT